MRIVAWNIAKRVESDLAIKELKQHKPDKVFLSEGNEVLFKKLEACKDIECHIVKSRRNSLLEYKLDKNGSNKILGVRFKNYKMSNADKKKQINRFFKYVDKKNPDVILGDFNVQSAISFKKKGKTVFSFSTFLTEMKDKGYILIDSRMGESTFSFQNKLELRKLSIGTCPDLVFVKKDSPLKVTGSSYIWAKANVSDHAMLVVDLENCVEAEN